MIFWGFEMREELPLQLLSFRYAASVLYCAPASLPLPSVLFCLA